MVNEFFAMVQLPWLPNKLHKVRGPQLHDSKAGVRNDLKSGSLTPMTVDAGLSWGPHCLSTPGPLYSLTLWASLGFLAAWWLACYRASIPKGREPDGNRFVFCASLGSHKCHVQLYTICRDNHKPPPTSSRENTDSPLVEGQQKSHCKEKHVG